MKKIISLLLITIILISALPFASADIFDESTLKIDYLDVGEGDAAFITCDGYNMLIDGGSPEHSDYIYSYLKKNNIKRIDYIIATHPDSDHIGGLSGALNYSSVGIVFCTQTEHDTDTFASFKKYLEKQNNRIIVPYAGDIFSLGGATVSILAPENSVFLSDNTSIVVRIEFGKTSFLFMGDAEEEDELALISSGANIKSDVLKIGHHGSSSSSTKEFLKKVSPTYAVISVGENTYGHPADDVLYRLKEIKANVYRTDKSGTITCISNGENISFDFEKQTEVAKNDDVSFQQTDTADLTTTTKAVTNYVAKSATTNEEKDDISYGSTTANYVVNINSGKFHYPDCGSVKKMNESNKWYYTGTRDYLISSGYSPCGNCHP